MFSKQEYKSHLLGCFEIMLFMRTGVERFSKTKSAAIQSFIWPVLLIPIALFAFSFHSDGYSLPLLMILHGARMIIALFLSLMVVYVFCRQFNRQEHFCQYVTASNWMNIPVFLMLMPIVIALVAHSMGSVAYGSYGEIVKVYESYAVFITMLAYVYGAFAMTHILRVPWEAAGAVTIVGLGIDQTMMTAMKVLRDYIAAV